MIKVFLNQTTGSIVLNFKNNKKLYLSCLYDDMVKYNVFDVVVNFNSKHWINLNDY